MQRWIVTAVVLGSLLVLGLGGGALAYRAHKRNQPTQVWLPIPTNPGLSTERRQDLVKTLQQKLSNPELLARVSKDVGLAKILNLSSNEEASRELGKRLFVKLGETDTPKGKVPTINVGMNCKVKEFNIMRDVITRLGTDAFTVLGIPQGPKRDVF